MSNTIKASVSGPKNTFRAHEKVLEVPVYNQLINSFKMVIFLQCTSQDLEFRETSLQITVPKFESDTESDNIFAIMAQFIY